MSKRLFVKCKGPNLFENQEEGGGTHWRVPAALKLLWSPRAALLSRVGRPSSERPHNRSKQEATLSKIDCLRFQIKPGRSGSERYNTLPADPVSTQNRPF